jgi:phosphoribosylamine--glycine ligase
MRILVLGSGAREHALAWKLSLEPGVTHVICAPGNPGIARTVATASVDVLDTGAVVRLVDHERIDLTVVGAEAPLGNGLADRFEAEGHPVFGPTKAAAQLETSKAFAKDFMQRHAVPTARYRVCTTAEAAIAAIRSGEFGDSLVVKADGLAGGKGVVVAIDRAMAEAAVTAAMVDRSFGDAGARVVLEEMLTGPEVSFFVVANGEHYVSLLSAQDHKRIFDGDEGPNTGGMGAFAPSPLVTPAIEQRVIDEIVTPVLGGMVREGHPYRGFLYVGLMLTTDGPKVIEFNVRFGDPEAEVIFPMIDEDLLPLLIATARGELRSRPVRFRREPHVCVVLASGGYPETADVGNVITGLQRAAAVPGALVFHAGTAAHNGAVINSGGRVITVVGSGATYQGAIDVAYEAASHVKFDGMQYRKDIGRKALGVS